MRVILIYPKTELQGDGEKPPLGLAYIASSLKLDEHEVMIEDMYGLGITMDQLIADAERFNPDVAGISVITPYITSASMVATQIKKHLNIPIIVGGPHPSSIPEKTLREHSSFDIAVRGEGEETMRELCKVIENKGDIQSVLGISFRKDGEIISTPPRPLIENLDDIPFPAWHLLQMDKYFKNTNMSLDAGGMKTFSIITSRGCPGRCKFCDSHSVWKRKYRARSATNVVDEIERLYNDYNIRFIQFVDDTLIVNKKRVFEICDQIKERNLDIKWMCWGRVNLVDAEVLRKMKDAGCVKIYYGIESGSQKILDYINKNITLEQAEHAVKITKKAGILTGAYWMMVFPPETEEDIKRTIEFNTSLPLDDHDTFSILTPFPGSELYKITKEEGLLLSEDWEYYYNRRADVLPVVRTRYLSNKDLHRLKKEGDRELLKATRLRMFKYYLSNPDKLLNRIIKDPKNLFGAVAFLIKNQIKIKSQVKYL